MGNHPRTSARGKRALTARIATLVTLLTSSMLLLAPAASAQTAGDISVAVTATPDSLDEPGGDFTFAVVVGNPGGEDVTIDSLMDDTYGDLATLAGSNCGGLIGDVLAPGTTSAICTFTGEFTGVAGDSQTNTVTVTGTTAGDTEVTAQDSTTVTITAAEEEEDDDATSVRVRYAVSPSTRAEPGGTFHFGVEVTNTGDDEVELTTLTDSVYGDLDGAGSCETGVLLDPDEEYTCTFEENFTGDAGDTQTNTVTATVEDDGGDDATDTASVEIAITEDSTTIDDGGGTTIVVNNSSSSSSSAAAAASGGRSAPSPTPKPTVTLVRTGADSLPMGAGGLGLLALGSLLIVTAERERRRRLYGGSRL